MTPNTGLISLGFILLLYLSGLVSLHLTWWLADDFKQVLLIIHPVFLSQKGWSEFLSLPLL